MNIIIAPDKFKGSLTSFEVCTAIEKGLQLADEDLQLSSFPMADGGDGFAAVMKYYTGTVTRQIRSVDPLGRRIATVYEWSAKDRTAFIELAACSGVALLKSEERNPMITSSYGTGIQIQEAIQKGAKQIILGIGGSATNDGGMGILSAMGFLFLDGEGNSLEPSGQSLGLIQKIMSPVVLPAVNFEIACDVNNPLYGPEGAAIVFSEQKGATVQQAQLLDDGLKHFAAVIQRETGKDVSGFPGTGAAGGIAAGLMAYLPVKIIEGTKLVLKASNIENRLHDADIIITGEGKIDRQSFRGKTICAVIALAKKKNIPAVALCGKLDLPETEWKQLGLSLAVEINDGTMTEQESMMRAHELILKKSESLVCRLPALSRKKNA